MAEKTPTSSSKNYFIKTIIIIVLVVLILLLLGGVVFYFYQNKNKEPKFNANTTTLAFAYAKDTTDSKKKPDAFIKYPTVALPKMEIPIVKDHGVVANLMFRVVVKLKNESAFEEFKFKIPYITDLIFVRIFNLYSNLWIPSTPLNQDTLMEHIAKAIESIFDQDKINELYIEDFFIE